MGIDDLNDAYDVRLKEWRLKQLGSRPGFTFHRLDITDLASLRPLFSSPSPPPTLRNPLASPHNPLTSVINLAARAGVRQSVTDPWGYYHTNVLGTLNLLELCQEHGVRKFIQASTSSVYGAPVFPCDSLHEHHKLNKPFSETDRTERPLSPYAASKLASESLCYTYHYLNGLDVSLLRYFTVYGPAGRPDMSIFRFIRWIAEGDPLILYGDGSQWRDYTYVDDIARGTVAALQPLGFEIINLGSDRPVSISHVVELLEDLLGKKARIQRQPAHPADVSATWADITKAHDLLGWKPETSLEEGLRQAVEWYRDNRAWAKEVMMK